MEETGELRKMESFYRRTLPSPPSYGLSTAQGRIWFSESLREGNAEVFFPLAEQFSTQAEPAFCGLTSLSMVLNALEIDPNRSWKGPWRWYHEEMLDCCEDIENVRKDGITFEKVACLARCNGLRVKSRIHPRNQTDPSISSIGSKEGMDRCHCSRWSSKSSREGSLEEFRKDLESSARGDGSILVVSYGRKAFGQTGDGHFSPIGAYHKKDDQVLILDVARYKYPPHWVPLELLWKAMSCIDKVTGRPRGYMRLSRDTEMHGHVLTINLRQQGSNEWLQFLLGNQWKEILNETQRQDPMDQLRALLTRLPSSPVEILSCHPSTTGNTEWDCCQKGEQSDAIQGIFQSSMRKAISQVLEGEAMPWIAERKDVSPCMESCNTIFETFKQEEITAILLSALLLAARSNFHQKDDESFSNLFQEVLTPAATKEIKHLESQLEALIDTQI